MNLEGEEELAGLESEKQAKKLRTALEELGEEHAQAMVDTQRKIEQLQDRVSKATYPGLNFPALRNLLTANVDATDVAWTGVDVQVLGSGPWDRDEFTNYLYGMGFHVHGGETSVATVILGANDVRKKDLETLLERDDAVIYTQEIFVLGLAFEQAPYEFLEQPEINQIGVTHRALQSLLQSGLVWPTWNQEEEPRVQRRENASGSGYLDYNWSSESNLHKFGYNVRSGELDADERHEMLRQYFEAPLRMIDETGDTERWGGPRSPRRLQAMASMLSWFINFQGADRPAARSRWIEDLEWLRDEFYVSEVTTGFEWPEQRTPALKRTPNAMFMKPLKPSPALAAIVGGAPLPRTELVSKLWAYIKKHNLQDQNNRRMVHADEKLVALFGKPQISMFEMAGLIAKHVS